MSGLKTSMNKLKRRKQKNKLYEFQLTDGRWLTINELVKSGICTVSKKTLTNRTSCYFSKSDHTASQFKTIEEMAQIPKTKGGVGVIKASNVLVDVPEDIFDMLHRLMPVGVKPVHE